MEVVKIKKNKLKNGLFFFYITYTPIGSVAEFMHLTAE